MAASRPSRREDFGVAIICMRTLEYDAVSLLFDEFWDEEGDQYGRATGDTNHYTTGRIGNHSVVLALLPQMGKANAASAAASMRSSYDGVRLALLVGICGGVPGAGDDEILLGDVVISKTIVQYDLGRQYPDGFVRKDTIEDNPWKPNKDVRSLLITLRTDRGRDRLQKGTTSFLKQLQTNATQKKRGGKYMYPGAAEDRLFEPSYRHKHRASPSCICARCYGTADPVCDEAFKSSCGELDCNEQYLVTRQRLTTKQQLERDNSDEAQEPAIYIGLIALGDTVMNSGTHRDMIAKKEGIIAFEMEGAGIWEELPCIVVKGVCDYADCHKTKRWGNFAAATAASAAKALLEWYIQTDNSRDCSVVRESSQPLSTVGDQHEPPKGDRTFRVCGVPLGWDVGRLQSFLADQDDAAGPTVRSLAEEIHGRSHTATVSFRNIPGPLQTSQTGRPMRVSLPGSNQLTRQQLLTVDDGFHGITTLYAPPQQDHKVDIITISGLGGHAFESFKEKGGEHMWLRDALPYDITGEGDDKPLARVMVYGYESKVAQSDSIQTLEDLGTSLHSSLLPLASATTLKPIIFVAHSLGGLIVKQTVISLSKSKKEDDQKLVRAVYGIVFFGVPYDGMDISSLISMGGSGPNRLIESIRKNGSQTLNRLHQEFHTALGVEGESEIFFFFETILSPTAIQDKTGKWEMKGPPSVLVTKPSATHCRPGEGGPEHICAINRTHSEMVKFGPEDPEYDKALAQIEGLARRAHKAHSRNQGQSANASQDGHWLVPFGRNEDFVGRGEILEQLLGIIPPSIDKDDCQRTAIEGLGGVGKTQIALEVAFRIQEQHPNCSVFWVPAVDATSFDNAFREIGQRLKVKGIDDDRADVRSLVKTALSESGDDWLLIVDNADDVELPSGDAALRDCLPFSRKGSILFTTRNHETVRKLSIQPPNVIHVGGMSKPEAVDLFKRSLGTKRTIDAQTTAELLGLFAYLPLAIKQASAYIDQTGMSMKRYLELCRSSDHTFVKLLGKKFEDQVRYKGAQNPVATTWLISFRQISRDNKLAAQHLRFMSFLAEDIPESLLPPGEDELEEDEAIGTLKAYAFISERADQRSYEMHRLVRLAMRNWLTEQGELKACVTAVIRRLNEVFPPPTHENRHAWAGYLPHALAALKFKDNATDDAVKMRLLSSVAESSQKLGKYKESEIIYRQTLGLRTKVLGNKHPDTLWSMHGVASALHNQGKYEQAEMIYRQTLKLRTRVLGAEHPDTINSMNDLAFTLGSQGKLEQAERTHRQTLELHTKMLNAEHPDTLKSMNNIAYTLRSQGEYEQAEILYRQTLELRTRVLGAEHPDTLDTMGCLALSLHAQGKYDQAGIIHRQTLELRTKVLGAEHPDTLSSMNNYAYTLRGQGKDEQAEVLDWQTLELRTKVLGAEHPNTIWSLNGLANGFRSQGKYEHAEIMYRQTLEVRTKVLGAEHPNTFDSLDNLASVLDIQGKYKEAEAMYRQALELGTKVRGAEHPHTLDSMNGLAHTLRSQGKYEQAEIMYWRTLKLRTEALGAEHPHSLETMNGLANTLSSQRQDEEAVIMYRQTLELRTKVLGAEHPDTLKSMNNLAVAKENLGKHKEAETIYRRTLELCTKVLGSEHPDTIWTRNKLRDQKFAPL